MLGRPSQAANVSTLLDAKKPSKFVISMRSNNRMQWSAQSQSLMVDSLLRCAPTDAER